MDRSQSVRQTTQILPKESTLTWPVQRPEPMVGTYKSGSVFERSNVARHDDVKCIIAFSRSQYPHDDFICPRESAHSLALAHFMPPKLPEIGIDGCPRPLPVFENHRITSPAVCSTNHRGL
jgi:hypothetical protein